jgi:hypothetical protein
VPSYDAVLSGRDGANEIDRWARTLGETLRVLAMECVDTCSLLHRAVVSRMESAFSSLVDAERDKNTDETAFFLVWRNYLVAAIATCGCMGAIVFSQVLCFRSKFFFRPLL